MRGLLKGLAGRVVKRYQGMSIQMVLSLSFTAVALVGVVFMGGSLLLRFSDSARNLSQQATRRVLAQVNLNLDSYLRRMMRVSDTMYYRVIKNTDLASDTLDEEMGLLYEENRDDLVSLAVFLAVMAGGTAFSVMYQKKQKEKLQEEVVEARTDRESHALGETFSLQGMKLTVVEAWAVDEGRKTYPDFPEGKKLAVVKLRGESDGEWADKNRLSDTYISCSCSYYKQVPTYEIDWEGGIPRDFPLFESYSLCMSSEAEGCLFFWVDGEVQDITLFLEERVDEDLVFIQTIHSIEVHLEEMDLGGQADA